MLAQLNLDFGLGLEGNGASKTSSPSSNLSSKEGSKSTIDALMRRSLVVPIFWYFFQHFCHQSENKKKG